MIDNYAKDGSIVPWLLVALCGLAVVFVARLIIGNEIQVKEHSMGIDYSAVGGYGYKYDINEFQKSIFQHLTHRPEDEVDLEATLDELDLFETEFKYIIVNDYDEIKDILFVAQNNNVYADFEPLKNWLRSIGLSVPGEPEILIELDVLN